MSIPDSGAEPLDAEGSSTSSTTRSTGVSTGSARTPPPRTRRGAPSGTGRSRSAEPNGDGEASGSSRPATSGGPKPTAASTKVFNWDDDGVASASSASATAALTVAAVTPLEEPEDAYATEPMRTRQPKPAKARRPERRFRQTVQRIDLWSVTKMALCFYISAMAVVVVALIALWAVADSAGIIDNVEKFIGDLFSAEDFHFVSDQVLRGAVLVAIVVVALMVVFTIIAASFYNIFAELFGGIEITIREEEHPPKR
jgi:hypothetical protein